MTDFLSFLYSQYIQPYVAAQPRDDADKFRESLCWGECSTEEEKDVEAVVRFSATHAFLLGLHTGKGLARYW